MSCIITLSVSSSVRLDGTIAGLLERVGDLFDELRALQLARRDVHGHRQRRLARAFLLHPRGPRAGLVQDVAPDLHDQPGFLEQRHELGRGEDAALGVLPARERLHAGHVAALEVHDRLVAQRELAGVAARAAVRPSVPCAPSRARGCRG